MKLVSLLPSATEIVYSLGCSKHLVGVSHECDSHPSVRFLKKLTTSKVKDSSSSVKIHQDIQYLLNQSLSVYEVNSELLRTLKPDIIITQSHCSACAVSINQVKDCLVKFLGKKPQLINLNPNNLDGIFNDIKKIGKGLKVNQESSSLISSIKRKFNDTLTKLSAAKSKNVLCIEWLNPIMTAGNWIPQLLYYCKANSIIAQQGVKSKIIDLKKISMEKVDVVIIMPCGFNIERSKSEYLKLNLKKLFEGKEVFIVDGNKYFNRPGPSLVESMNILCEVLHPEIFERNPSLERWVKI